LIGDAAGYNNPTIGQELALAMRDVRRLAELLLVEREWSPARLQPYVDERFERMRRVRFTAELNAALRSEFGPDAVARRHRFFARLASGTDKSLRQVMAAQGLGPDRMRAWGYEDDVRQRVLARGPTDSGTHLHRDVVPGVARGRAL
jgi:2-polyprenyl-6-methoxyphenol hydroxylase-like FAD-dependent oxidoreductase